MRNGRADDLEARLRAIGAERYHDKHPFHALLHGGRLDKGQVQAWALNRYCYQAAIPRKDAALVARLDDRALRRAWLPRILEHDGGGDDQGGIERWLMLTDGLDLDRAYVVSQRGVLPAVRFAVEAYVRFVAERSVLEAIASSLTELFAPALHTERIAGMLANYEFVGEPVMAYFRRRLVEAPRDVAFALAYVREHARTEEEKRLVEDALRFKCAVLWAQLDAIHHAYVAPRLPPPGAFVPNHGLPAGSVAMTAQPAAPPSDDRLGETPRLAAGVRLARDEHRGCWVLQAPERVFVLDEIAYEIIRRCDGRTVRAIIEDLAHTFEAGKDEIASDVLALIDDLHGRGAFG